MAQQFIENGTKVIGVGGLDTVGGKQAGIKTYALGSCVAVIFIRKSPLRVGMAHIALPHSAARREKSVHQPGYFADLAVPLLIQKICPKREYLADTRVFVIGGAKFNDSQGLFQIGKRNIDTILGILAERNIKVWKTDIGGENLSRTVEVDLKNMKVIIQYGGKKRNTVIDIC